MAAVPPPSAPPHPHTLDIRGERGVLSGDHASTLVAHVMAGAKRDYKRVILSNWGFTEDAARVFKAALDLLPDVESAILADIIAGRMEEEGLAVYRHLGEALRHRQLLEIDLSDNAVGPKGLAACAAFLSNQARLEKLYFCNCGISAEAARSIADLVLFRLPTAFTTLHFYNNMSGTGGAIAIADIVSASPHLRDFRFSSSRGGNDGGVALAKALRAAPKLERLDFNDNMFGAPTGVALGHTLRHLVHITRLNVGDLGLGDEGLAALASGIVRGCAGSLTLINVAANDITEEGAKALARIVRRCPNLAVVHADDNELEDAGVKYLARAITRRAAFRGLAASYGGGAGGARSGSGGAAAAAGAAASGSGGSGSNGSDPLAEINVAGNQIRNHGGLALAQAIAAHLPNFAKLLMHENDLTTAGVARVRAELAAVGKEGALASMEDEEGGDDEEDEEEEEEEEAGDEEPLDADDEESDEEEWGRKRAAGEEVCVGEAAEEARGKGDDADVDAVAEKLAHSFEL